MSEHHRHQSASGFNAIDPVCGMTVDPATSKHRSERAGEVVHFCSASCKAKFDAEPAKYVQASPKPAATGSIESN